MRSSRVSSKCKHNRDMDPLYPLCVVLYGCPSIRAAVGRRVIVMTCEYGRKLDVASAMATSLDPGKKSKRKISSTGWRVHNREEAREYFACWVGIHCAWSFKARTWRRRTTRAERVLRYGECDRVHIAGEEEGSSITKCILPATYRGLRSQCLQGTCRRLRRLSYD